MKINVKNMTVEELRNFFISIDEKKFRADQVFEWLCKGVTSFDEMTNLSKDLREKLKLKAEICSGKILKVQISEKDGTRKYLFGFPDGNAVESVFMKYRFGNSVCISSQAGCRMGCIFCASAQAGLKRNLTGGEMMDQISAIEKDTGERIGNIVVMGTGEPFDNYGALSRFLRLVHAEEGLNVGLRSITVSTCGIIPKMREFSEEFPQVNLAVSLHGPTDAIRSKIMPVNNRYGLMPLMEVCREHTRKTGRRITFEYALIKGMNDKDKHASELAELLSGMLCHVNLIPLNSVTENEWVGSDRRQTEKFKEILEKRGISVTVRREMGADIDGACGQLRAGYERGE